MEEWLKEQVARGFVDFEGTTLTGSVPVKTELINQLITHYLTQAGSPAPSHPAGDFRQLVRLVRSVTVEAAPGLVTLRFEIGV